MLFRSVLRAGSLLAASHGFVARGGPSSLATARLARGGSLTTMSAAPPAPVTIVVVVEIEEARLPAFREAMAIDCAGSREEEGCLRFDLLQDSENPNKFVFYEACGRGVAVLFFLLSGARARAREAGRDARARRYKDADAVAKHKTFDHYKAWADFKAAGGVKSQEVIKAAGVDFTY